MKTRTRASHSRVKKTKKDYFIQDKAFTGWGEPKKRLERVWRPSVQNQKTKNGLGHQRFLGCRKEGVLYILEDSATARITREKREKRKRKKKTYSGRRPSRAEKRGKAHNDLFT